MPFESRISKTQPCFRPPKNIQFRDPRCFSRSTLVDMKLRVFRMFFSLLLAGTVATGLAVATVPAKSNEKNMRKTRNFMSTNVLLEKHLGSLNCMFLGGRKQG